MTEERFQHEEHATKQYIEPFQTIFFYFGLTKMETTAKTTSWVQKPLIRWKNRSSVAKPFIRCQTAPQKPKLGYKGGRVPQLTAWVTLVPSVGGRRGLSYVTIFNKQHKEMVIKAKCLKVGEVLEDETAHNKVILVIYV